MMFDFFFRGPPANGFFETNGSTGVRAVTSRIQNATGPGGRNQCLQHEMDMDTNAEDFFSLDTSFACNREEVWTRPFVQILGAVG